MNTAKDCCAVGPPLHCQTDAPGPRTDSNALAYFGRRASPYKWNFCKVSILILLPTYSSSSSPSCMLFLMLSCQISLNSFMSRPLLRLSASKGTMLCWLLGALEFATGCEGESITRNSGSGVSVDIVSFDRAPPLLFSSRRFLSSSYENSSESVCGAYGLKSTIWARDRSRVRRRSKTSICSCSKNARILWKDEECTISLSFPPRFDLRFPKLYNGVHYLWIGRRIIQIVIIICIALWYPWVVWREPWSTKVAEHRNHTYQVEYCSLQNIVTLCFDPQSTTSATLVRGCMALSLFRHNQQTPRMMKGHELWNQRISEADKRRRAMCILVVKMQGESMRHPWTGT